MAGREYSREKELSGEKESSREKERKIVRRSNNKTLVKELKKTNNTIATHAERLRKAEKG